MNELALSTDLKQIELEIQHHKNLAGQSIWEIGRRLNHVKENDLAHGSFGVWLEEQGINHREANRMMKVAEELPNSTTLSILGTTALYLIATLPEEEKKLSIRLLKGNKMEREKVYNKKRQEVLVLLNVIKYRAIPLRYFDGDLEKEINRLTFLAVKLRQIAR